MPTHIPKPTVIEAAGNLPKRIEEFAGRVNSGHASVSVARMVSPAGWQEPGQRPDFEEITVVLRGALRVEHGAALSPCGLEKRSWRVRASGSATALRNLAAPSTLPSVCRRSRHRQSAATRDD
jgi:hypothetical protein